MKKILKKLTKIVNLKKTVALATAVIFVSTTVMSQGYAGMMPGAVPVVNSAALGEIANKVIPFNIGKITDALYSGKSGSVVINIQDLHSHAETQRNISTILEILDKKYGLERVYVEGAYGEVNTKWLSSIKDKRVRETVLNNMLESGRLTGSEYYAVENGRDGVIEGIEEKQVYIDNLKRLNEIYKKKQEIGSYIPHIEYILEKKAEIYYSQSNRKLNRIIRKNKEGEISAERYFTYLIQAARKGNIDLSKYREIINFIVILEKQRKIDAEKINAEISGLLTELKGKLSYDQYKQLTVKLGDKATESEFYFDLLKVAESKGLMGESRYRNINLFLEYMILSQSVNPIELTYEEKGLVREIHNRFAVNEFEREIYFLKEYVEYMKGYLNNKLTADEYEYFTANMGTFKVMWKKYVDIDGIIDISRYMELFEKFYSENVERNRYFIKNVMGIMPQEEKEGIRIKADVDHQGKVLEEINGKKDIKVVITGGFHTYGFTKLLEDEGISYIVVTPNVTESAATAEQKYEEIFRQQSGVLYNTLQKMFVSQLGRGAVLNADVLKTKGLTVEILNGMLSELGIKERITGLNIKGKAIEVTFDNGNKIEVGVESVGELSGKEKEVLAKYEETFKVFNDIQKAFRQIREAKRGGKVVTIDINRIKEFASKVENPAIKKQLQEAIERLGKSEKIGLVRKELERLAKYPSTRLTQGKIDEVIFLLEQGKLVLRNENFDIIEKDGQGRETVIGVVDRNIAHRLELHHRVSCMFVATPQGTLINIRRALHKSEPGQITPYGGHVSSGESYETTRERELVEELGLPEGWKLQGRFEHLVTEDKYPQEAFEQKHEVMLDNDSMNLSAYFPSDEELRIVRTEMAKLEELRKKMNPQQYNMYLEENAIENYDIQEFALDDFMRVVNASGNPVTSYVFADGSKIDFQDSFPDFFKRILFSKRQDTEKFKNIVVRKDSVKDSELKLVLESIQKLAGDKYSELMEQTKKDIARMIETDAFLSKEEKNLPASEKTKLVEERIVKVLSQLERYLSGYLEGLIPSSSEKSVGFGTAGNRGITGEDFDFNNVALIAQAMANIINADPSLPKAVFVGNDTRFLGKWYSIVMERILTANGIQVYTAKEKIATPTIACYVKEIMPGKFAATLNITASHNPKEYNGVKPNSGDGAPALPEFTKKITEEIKRIQDNADGKTVKIAQKENSIIVTDADIKHFEYVRDRLNALIGVKEGETIESFRQRAARIGIVLDGKNTALMPVLKSLLEYYGFKNIIVINDGRDVAFGGKVNPEPNDKNTIELSDMVKEGKSLFAEKGMEVDFSFGISTDPDGDRFCVKDVSGMHMTPDEVGTIDAYELLENIIEQMKAKRDAGTLKISEIKKFEAVIVKSMVTTFALDALAEVYSKEFMDIAFGEGNNAVSAKDKTKYAADYNKGKYIPFSVIATPVGWKNIADGQKLVEKAGKRFLIGVESSGGISIGLYDKDGAPATMMPVLFAAKSGETLEQKLEKVEKKIGLKVHSIETAIKFPIVVEAEIEKVTKNIIDVEVIENEIDGIDVVQIKAKKIADVKKAKVVEMAKKELNETDQWYETATVSDIVKKMANARQKALLDWIENADIKEIEQLLYNLGMSKGLKVVKVIKWANEGMQIQIAGADYKEGDIVKTILTLRASGTEPLVRVYAYTNDGKLTTELKDIGENIIKGAFKQQGVLKTESTVSTAVSEGLKNALNPIPSIIAAAIDLLSGESRVVLAKAVKRIYGMSEKDREEIIKSVSEKYPGFELRFVGNASKPESLELKIGVFYSLHFDGTLYRNANEPDTVPVSTKESVPEAVKSVLSEIIKYGKEFELKEATEQTTVSGLSEIITSIELLGKDYPELVEQTKRDIARMIETDAFLSDKEKELPADEKAKLVEAKISVLLLQLEKYLEGDLKGLILPSSEKIVKFGTAGNRGQMVEEFDFNNVALIAQAMANIINADASLPKAVFVGNDTRFLGKWFAIVMERVLTANGIQVYTTKEKIATPTISFYVKEVMPGKFGATLNVTASHNPKEHNGVKPNFGDGAPAIEKFTEKIANEIRNIQDSVDGKAVKIASKENSIIVTDAEIKHFEYVREKLNALIGVKEGETIESFRQRAARIGIVLDGKNTALMPVLKSLLEYYGFKNVIIINDGRDVAFGGKVNPEPNEGNTKDLEDMVNEGKSLFKERGMDVDFSFGISTDPDGDRFCVKDVSGKHMTPDEIGTIDAYELLENIIAQMKARRNDGMLTISEIKKFEAVIVRTKVTTFALDALAEVYSREFMDIAFGYSNKAVDDRARVYYRSAFAKGEYTPFSVRTTPVGWKNIADGQKAVEKEGKRFLIGVESSGGISIGLYDKDGAPATMMPVLFATKSGETLEEKLAQVEKKIGFKVHSIETKVELQKIIEAEIEDVTKNIMDIEVTDNEVDEADSSKTQVNANAKNLADVIKIAKKELDVPDEWYQNQGQDPNKIIEVIVKEIANKRKIEIFNWLETLDRSDMTPKEKAKIVDTLLHTLGMSEELKVKEFAIWKKEGIQIQIVPTNYKEGDNVTFLTLRASGTEPAFRVYVYTVDEKLTTELKDIGESIVKGAFKTITPVLTDMPEYKKAQRAARRDKTSIRDKFAADSSKPEGERRGDLYQKRVDLGNGSSMLFDFSRSVMTDKLMKLFVSLFTARKIKEKIEAMFRGDKINWTEKRAVLHTALRNTSDEPVYVDGKDVMPKVREVLQKMKDFSNKIITGQWKGVTGKPITDIVSIGIGGSDLGPRMATEALSQFRADGAPRVHFISNVDPNDINSVLNELGLDPETTLFIIESKTFTTEETMTNASIAKQWATDKLGDTPDVIKKHFVAVSTNKEKVAEFGIDTENMFEFWDWVGGRYSVWSAVGLPLMCSIGYDNFMEFLDGANAMDVHFRTTPYEQNVPMIMAMLNIANSNFLGRKAYAILPYNRYLKLFTAHIQQVYMESLGKSVDSQGRRIKYQTGSEVYGTAGTDAQHSYLQEHHQGTDIIPVDFIGFAKTRLADPAMQTSHKRLLANMIAQADAMAFGRTYEETVEQFVSEGMDRAQAERMAKDQIFDGNRPSNILMFNELNPRTLGALIALYENMVATLGAVWDVDFADQMGVKLGKERAQPTFKALKQKIFEGFNSASENLIKLISGKLEISGVWDSVKNSWWVKILSRIINPQNTFEGQMRVRNLAVAIKEFPRTLNLEKFIQAHDQPENVRQQATELSKITKQSFVKSLSIAWTGALFGALGIALTAATGGLFLVGTIAVTSILFLIPFITASITNIKWHYNYNNKVDEDETYLIEIGLLNNAQARNYVRERLLSDPAITEGMTENEKINYYAYVKIADQTDLSYMFLNNPALFSDVTDLLGNKVDKLIIDIEEYVFSGTGLSDLSLSACLKFAQEDATIMRKFEALKAWLMINVGLDAAAVKILFDDPEGISVIKSLADKKQVERAVKLLSNPNDSEAEKKLKSLNREAYIISRMFKKYPALLDTAENASYDYDTALDAILQVIKRIEKSKLETGKTKHNDYASDENIGLLAGGLKILNAMGRKDKERIIKFLSEKYPGLEFRITGDAAKPETLVLRIGVFFAVHSDGQLYKNANEPDTIAIDASDKLPENIVRILEDIKLLVEANAFYETKFTELKKAVFAPIEMTALFKGLLDEGYDDLLSMGSKYDDAVAVLQNGFKKYEQYFKEDQQKDLKYYINLKTLIENSRKYQIENMKYIYGGHELIADFEKWMRQQIGLGAIYDMVDSKGVWDQIGFSIKKNGLNEEDWTVTFDEDFEAVLRIQALNISANLARRDGYEKLEKGANGQPTERLGRVLEGILQNELGPTYAGQAYNTDAYVNFDETMLKRRAFMQYLAFIAVIKAVGTATADERAEILGNPALTKTEIAKLSKVLDKIKHYYNESVKGREYTEGTLGTERLPETAALLKELLESTKLGFKVFGSQRNRIRQSCLTVFSAAPGAGKGTLSDYIFSNDKGAKKGMPNIYKFLYDGIRSQLFHTRTIRTHLFEKTGDVYNFIPPENINDLASDGSVVDEDGNPVKIKVVKVNGQLQGAVIGAGALIPVRYFIKNNPTENIPWDYYLLEGERVSIEQWKKENPGRDIKEMTLTRPVTGMGVLFASDKLTYMEGGLAWKLELEKEYPNINNIFINSYDSATKKSRAASDIILHKYVTAPEELRKANEILRRMRIDANKEIDLRDNVQLNKLLRALGKDETAATSLINSSLSPIVVLIQSFVKNIQLASLALLYKDKTSYTIVADVNDAARIQTANILAAKGIKVNLILVGATDLSKETKERLEQDGKLAYGLVDKKNNLTVYAAEKIDSMTDAEIIEAIIKNIKSTDKSDIMILDTTSSVYDELLGKDVISDMVVKPNASPNELFIEALKQKQGKQKEQILQFAGIAENISAEQIDGYDGAKIQSAKEKGLTTINITVDPVVIAGKTEKLLELIKSAHANGLKVVFNYKVDFRKTGLDAFIKNIPVMTKTFRQFAIDGINLDLSDLGELASVSYLLIALTKLQKEIKNLAVKMPSEIAETEYKGIFNKNGIKRIVNYKDIRNVTDRQNVIVDVNIDKDANNIFDQKELMSLFVNNNISMVAFDSRIIEAFDRSNDGFSFIGIKNVAELLSAIFNTTPEGQYLKGIIKGRNISAENADATALYELFKDGKDIAVKIKKYLPESEREKEYTEQQAKGILLGILEQMEWNAADGNKLVFKNKDYQDMFMEMLVKYRLLTGGSYSIGEKNIDEILEPVKNNEKAKEVLRLINGQDSAYNTEFASINILSSLIEDEISSDEKTAVLEGLLTLLLGTSREVNKIDIMETMKVEDISAILKAA